MQCKGCGTTIPDGASKCVDCTMSSIAQMNSPMAEPVSNEDIVELKKVLLGEWLQAEKERYERMSRNPDLQIKKVNLKSLIKPESAPFGGLGARILE